MMMDLRRFRIPDLDEAWRTPGHGARLRAVRRAGEGLRERLAAGPRALAVRTLPLTELPYPTRYALNGLARSPAPYVTLTHRCLLVQFLQEGDVKHLLFNPTDVGAARATPFFARLGAKLPARLEGLVARRCPRLEDQLADAGVSADDIDFVAFDHFHTQDLRGLLGTADGAVEPRFRNAVLLAPRIEWEGWDDLHPMQRDWYVADGKRGVAADRVVLTDSDLRLGDGVLLVRTPGHTQGNQTLFVSTSTGVWGCSENGTCADSWSPLDSRIAGVASRCRKSGIDVVLNANTPETAADQYASMVLERTLVDRVRRAPAFAQMFPSSEITPSALAPGLAPTLLHRAIAHGDLTRPRRAAVG